MSTYSAPKWVQNTSSSTAKTTQTRPTRGNFGQTQATAGCYRPGPRRVCVQLRRRAQGVAGEGCDRKQAQPQTSSVASTAGRRVKEEHPILAFRFFHDIGTNNSVVIRREHSPIGEVPPAIPASPYSRRRPCIRSPAHPLLVKIWIHGYIRSSAPVFVPGTSCCPSY